MAKTFKTLAEFKRNLRVGDKIAGVRTKFSGRDADGKLIHSEQDLGIREVSIVQSNSFALKTVQTTGTGEPTNESANSWCEYPKASMARIEDNVLIILHEDRVTGDMIPSLTYKFVD